MADDKLKEQKYELFQKYLTTLEPARLVEIIKIHEQISPQLTPNQEKKQLNEAVTKAKKLVDEWRNLHCPGGKITGGFVVWHYKDKSVKITGELWSQLEVIGRLIEKKQLTKDVDARYKQMIALLKIIDEFWRGKVDMKAQEKQALQGITHVKVIGLLDKTLDEINR
jgi:hypothetical protein